MCTKWLNISNFYNFELDVYHSFELLNEICTRYYATYVLVEGTFILTEQFYEDISILEYSRLRVRKDVPVEYLLAWKSKRVAIVLTPAKLPLVMAERVDEAMDQAQGRAKKFKFNDTYTVDRPDEKSGRKVSDEQEKVQSGCQGEQDNGEQRAATPVDDDPMASQEARKEHRQEQSDPEGEDDQCLSQIQEKF